MNRGDITTMKITHKARTRRKTLCHFCIPKAGFLACGQFPANPNITSDCE